MNMPTQKLLFPTVAEYIKSLSGVDTSLSTGDNKDVIDDDTPITASYFDGEYKSTFKDNIWFVSELYRLNFEASADHLSFSDIQEIKVLSFLFLEIPLPRGEGLYKRLLSPKTVVSRTATLKALKKTSALNGKTLFSLFSEKTVSSELAREIQYAENNNGENFSLIISNLQGILAHVSYLSKRHLNISFDVSENLNKVLKSAYDRARASSEQHTVIPPIIYSQIYIDGLNIIKEWDSNKFYKDANELLTAYTDLSDTGSNNKKPAGVSRKAFQGRLSAFLTHEEKTYQKPGNYHFFKNKIKKIGQVDSSSFFYGSRNITGVTYEIRRVQAFLARFIMQETGMRENELICLLDEDLKTFKTPKGIVYAIQGKETKISGGERVCWIVSKNGKAAHEILRQLSNFSYQIHIKPTDRPKWLFPRLSCAIVDKEPQKNGSMFSFPDGRSVYCTDVVSKPVSITSLFKYDDPENKDKTTWLDRVGDYTLSSPDVNFLRTYATQHNNLNDNVQPEQVFAITEHQFRRSLAFYASGSGLLPITDLKFQLKHLAIVTTYYYADGGKALQLSGLLLDDETYKELNDNMIKESEHVDIILRKELLRTLDESSETVFGPGRNVLKHFSESIKHSNNPDKQWSDLAKDGAIKTKELPHGWCITTQPCDDFANQNFQQCFNCANGILERDKCITLIQEIRDRAKSAKYDFNKRSLTNLADKMENTARGMYPTIFKDII